MEEITEGKEEGLQLGLGVGEHYYATTTTTQTKTHQFNNTDCIRKKLKLTHDQSRVLENYFSSNNSLNMVHKKELAEKLKLKPRQIEVWFQNRRARTKMKKTEKDYELLKERCEILSNENTKLRTELQELRSSLIKDESSNHELLHARFSNTAKCVTCVSCDKEISKMTKSSKTRES